jgi:galactose mutarotase-like enzyme
MIEKLECSGWNIAVSSLGAELQSVRAPDGLEYFWQGDPAFWSRRSPILFPIVGKLRDGEFRWKGKSYPMGQHGFARDREFTLLRKGNDFLQYNLKADAETRTIFPWDFSLVVEYRLKEGSLQILWNVEPGQGEGLLFSIGGHPAFRCPLFEHETWEDYLLVFQTEGPLKRWKMQDGLLSQNVEEIRLFENRLALRPDLFDEDVLVFAPLESKEVGLLNPTTGRGVVVQAEGFPYFGIWSKKGGAPFVCLEPWHGVADAADSGKDFAEKKGIIRLNPGERFESGYQIHFE